MHDQTPPKIACCAISCRCACRSVLIVITALRYKNVSRSAKDLPENLTSTTSAAANVFIQLPDDGIDLEEVEREILRQALEKHCRNQTRTARYLNVIRSAPIYRMQKYGLKQLEL